jgi:hypothetical protein
MNSKISKIIVGKIKQLGGVTHTAITQDATIWNALLLMPG